MTAQAERSLPSLAHACSRARMLTVLHAGIALVAVVIGVLCLLGASLPVHALFGVLLCGLVFARYRWCIQNSTDASPADFRRLSRHLSHIVYVLLYVVLAVRQIIGLVNSVWHGGAVDFNLFDQHFRNGPDYAGWNPRDDFQLFLATGLLVLIIIRVFAFRLWLRSVVPRLETYP